MPGQEFIGQEFIGQGYNQFSQKTSPSSALKVDLSRLLKPSISENSATATVVQDDEKLKGQVIITPATSGVFTLTSFDSLSALKKLTSNSLSLAGKMAELGVSLEVSASREQTVDVTRLYYLLRVTSIERGRRCIGTPDLDEEALKVLGLLPDPVITEMQAVATEEAALAAAKITADAENQKVTKAQAQLAEVDLKIAQLKVQLAAVNGVLQNDANNQEAIKQRSSLTLSIALAEAERNPIDNTLTTAIAAVVTTTGNMAIVQGRLTIAKGRLVTEKNTAKAAVNADILRAFYNEFGTDYIQTAIDGRELIALITVDRSKFSEKRTLDLKAGITADMGSLEGKHHSELSRLTDEAIIDIQIGFSGIKASVASKKPQTMDDLYEIISNFYKKENHLEEPACIDFSITSYDKVLKAAGITTVQLQPLAQIVKNNQTLLDQLLGLRQRAVHCYSIRQYQDRIGRALGPRKLGDDNAINLDRDPHNMRLNDIFTILKNIIIHCNTQIDHITADPFIAAGPVAVAGIGVLADVVPVPAQPPAAVTISDFLTQQLPLVKTYEDELRIRGGYKLLYVEQKKEEDVAGFWFFRHYPTIKIRNLELPWQATYLAMACFNGPAHQGDRTVAEADNALGWYDKFSFRVKQRTEWYKLNRTVIKKAASNDPDHSHTVDRSTRMIKPEVREGSTTFYLSHFKSIPPALAVPAPAVPANMTLRIFAGREVAELGLQPVDVHVKDTLQHTISAGITKQPLSNFFSKGSKPSDQVLQAYAQKHFFSNQ